MTIAGIGFALAGPTTVSAAVVHHCVSDAAQFVSVLATTAGDGNTDFVFLAAGTYASPPTGFITTVQGSGDHLVIVGGYKVVAGNCVASTRPDPRLTRIDGAGVNPGMSIHGGTNGGVISVQNLTFVAGHRDQMPFQSGGALAIDASNTFTGSILIDRVIFRDNVASGGGGALSITPGSQTSSSTVRNSLFVGNSSDYGSALAHGPLGLSKDLISNTFIGNSAATTIVGLAATVVRTGTSWGFSNNIFWGNTTSDQFDIVTGEQENFAYNDVERMMGTPHTAIGVPLTLSVDPGFRSASDFHLRLDSPLINAGTTTPFGGIANYDLDGLPRVVAGTVDYGAYGHDVILMEGFN
ncbi:MAG: choice-of-anchor Q domain-containing protein [Dokdonella sp.]